MSELITVPTFTFSQGRLGDEYYEIPIQVIYYRDCINIQQDGGYDIPENINIKYEQLEKLFKEIKKHIPEAKAKLNK